MNFFGFFIFLEEISGTRVFYVALFIVLVAFRGVAIRVESNLFINIL